MQRLPWGGGILQRRLDDSNRTNASSIAVELQPGGHGAAAGHVLAAAAARFQDRSRSGRRSRRRSATSEIADIDLEELGVQTLVERASAPTGIWCWPERPSPCSSDRSICRSSSSETIGRASTSASRRRSISSRRSAEVAQRRENLIIAQTLVRQAEDNLRLLIIDPKRARLLVVRLEPADLVPPIGPAPDVDAAVRMALQQRTDLLRTRKQIRTTTPPSRWRRARRCRICALQASYLTNGLGRNGADARRVSRHRSSASSSRRTVTCCVSCSRRTTRRGRVGFTISYPLGQERWSRRRWRGPQLERDAGDRAAAQRRVQGGSRDPAGGACSSNRTGSGSKRRGSARELSEQRLDAEQKRYDVGMSTNFNVIQAQRDLAVARNDELQAQLDYQLALIAFNMVQKVGGALSGTPSRTSRLQGPCKPSRRRSQRCRRQTVPADNNRRSVSLGARSRIDPVAAHPAPGLFFCSTIQSAISSAVSGASRTPLRKCPEAWTSPGVRGSGPIDRQIVGVAGRRPARASRNVESHAAGRSSHGGVEQITNASRGRRARRTPRPRPSRRRAACRRGAARCSTQVPRGSCRPAAMPAEMKQLPRTGRSGGTAAAGMAIWLVHAPAARTTVAAATTRRRSYGPSGQLPAGAIRWTVACWKSRAGRSPPRERMGQLMRGT